MAFELIILGALIFIFIISFCGLLQKIKQTYERERILAAQMLADRMIRRREQEMMRERSGSGSFTEVYINSTFVGDGVFPGAPPAYSQFYTEPPPKYDDVVKVHGMDTPSLPQQETTVTITVPEIRTISSEITSNDRRVSDGSNPPPPYTVAMSSA